MERIKPMLADKCDPFDSDKYLFEIKWDGCRGLLYYKDGKITFINRSGRDITDRYPEFQDLGKQLNFGTLKKKEVILDGEIIVMRDGLPSFHDLQLRDHLQNPSKIAIRCKTHPAIYVSFDCLSIGGVSIMDRPLIERKRILHTVVKENENFLLSKYVEGNGKKLYKEVVSKGIEGIMAKKKDSVYSQSRSGAWLKIKKISTIDCVIVGYTKGTGHRSDKFGAVLLGLYNAKGKLTYVGRAGSGFNDEELEEVGKMMDERLSKCPIDGDRPSKSATWVKPELVAEVSFMEWSDDMVLRFPRWKCLRTDKLAKDCLMEAI